MGKSNENIDEQEEKEIAISKIIMRLIESTVICVMVFILIVVLRVNTLVTTIALIIAILNVGYPLITTYIKRRNKT